MGNNTCSIEDCASPARAKGLCGKHYARVKRTGSADTSLVAVSYGNAHKQVVKAKGKASLYRCINCPELARHWSYDHLDHDEHFDSQRGLAYSMQPRHYRPRCVKCHQAHDARFHLASYAAVSHIRYVP